MKFSSSPLTFKVGYAILAVSVSLTIVLTFAQVVYDFQMGKSEIESQVVVMEKTLAPSIAHAAWHFDSLQLKALLSGIVQNENVAGVKIYIDSTGSDAFMQLNTDNPNDGGSSVYPITVENQFGKNETIGKIEFLLTHTAISKRSLSLVASVALAQLVRTIIISYFIYMLLMNMVINRLIDVKRYLTETQQDIHTNVRPPENTVQFFEDEINSLNSQTVETVTKLQMAKEQANKELEARQQIQSRLVEISLQLGSFQSVAGIFHDLNNIIMIAYTTLSRMKRSPGEVSPALYEQMEKAFDLAKGLVKSQQQISMKSLNSEQLNVSAVVKDILLLNSFELRRQGISTSVEIDANLECYTSRSMLMLVILNLLKNSAEAIVSHRQSMGKISLRAKRSGDFVSLIITDNGPGISKEYGDKLFAFGETTKAEGHGFGLNSCKKSLQSLGGDLIFIPARDSSEPGACFEILIPASAQNLSFAA